MNSSFNKSDYLPQPYNRQNQDLLLKSFGYPPLSEQEHHENLVESVKLIKRIKEAWGIMDL